MRVVDVDDHALPAAGSAVFGRVEPATAPVAARKGTAGAKAIQRSPERLMPPTDGVTPPCGGHRVIPNTGAGFSVLVPRSVPAISWWLVMALGSARAAVAIVLSTPRRRPGSPCELVERLRETRSVGRCHDDRKQILQETARRSGCGAHENLFGRILEAQEQTALPARHRREINVDDAVR